MPHCGRFDLDASPFSQGRRLGACRPNYYRMSASLNHRQYLLRNGVLVLGRSYKGDIAKLRFCCPDVVQMDDRSVPIPRFPRGVRPRAAYPAELAPRSTLASAGGLRESVVRQFKLMHHRMQAARSHSRLPGRT